MRFQTVANAKVGDRVTVTYMQALAVFVRKNDAVPRYNKRCS